MLAEQADVGLSTIQKIEDINGDPSIVSTLQWRSDVRNEAIAKIKRALEAAGITFLPERDGNVGLRGNIPAAKPKN
jgi:hypothetical protein